MARGGLEPAAIDPGRPGPPRGSRSWVLLVLDSCRYDSFARAEPRNLLGVGSLERRWSYATWTAPSHHAMLMGLMPHPSPPGRHAAEVYREEFARYRDRLGVDLDLAALAPGLWLPDLLRARGWATGAWVSLPVLNPATPLNRGFDRYELRARHDDLAGILDDLRFYDDRPSFWLINAGETHYPYTTPARAWPALPRISGFHGVVRRHGEAGDLPEFFDGAALDALRERQVEAVRYVDGLLPALRALAPPGTWLTVTADHGECFGEGGYFGHGPIHHEKVLEVPLLEGPLL